MKFRSVEKGSQVVIHPAALALHRHSPARSAGSLNDSLRVLELSLTKITTPSHELTHIVCEVPIERCELVRVLRPLRQRLPIIRREPDRVWLFERILDRSRHLTELHGLQC